MPQTVFNTNLLTSQSECVVLIGKGTTVREDLEYRRLGLQRQVSNFTENTTEVMAKVSENSAELAANTTIINALQAGPKKEQAITEQLRLQADQRDLSQKAANYNMVNVLDLELQLEQIKQRIVAIDTFLAAVEARKAELPA